MAPVSLQALPTVARGAWRDLTRELRHTLGDDLVAIWAHGGTISVGDEPHTADLDTYVVVARRPDAMAVRAIQAAHDAIARDRGVAWDAWYVLEAAARRAGQPRHALREGSRDTSWAIHRAHWLAGRYVQLHGPAPEEIVLAPTWDELIGELSRELEHIERHVVEGDTDPFEATYALLNGSRILHAVETGDVALSKAAAGAWALEHLPLRWHAALHAALHAYAGKGTAEEVRLLATEIGPFVASVRERLPYPDRRPQGTIPRWSGS